MSVSVQIGLLLALATAFASVLGFLYKHRGAVESPRVDMRRPISTSLALFRNPWYTLGIVVAMAGWGFHVGALALAPISLVQATIAGGLVLLTVTADRLFAHEVTRREWVGVALAALGLAFLAATLGDTADEAHSDYEVARLAIYLVVVSRRGVRGRLARGRERPRGGAVRRLRRSLLGGLGHGDQGAQRQPRRVRRARDPHPPARRADRARVPGRAGGLGAQPPGRQGRAGDRRDQRGGERADDRRRPDRVRGAAARGHAGRDRRGWRRSRS